MTVLGREATATAGRFTVTATETGGMTVQGPKAYMADPAGYGAMRDRLERGESAVVEHAPTHLSLAQVVAVALQTDYAGWCGRQSMERVLGK